jgi:hypothetical protein
VSSENSSPIPPPQRLAFALPSCPLSGLIGIAFQTPSGSLATALECPASRRGNRARAEWEPMRKIVANIRDIFEIIIIMSLLCCGFPHKSKNKYISKFAIAIENTNN